MRALTLIALLAGALAGALLVGHYGVARVGQGLLAVGVGGFAVVVGIHLLVTVVMGLAWRVLGPPPGPVGRTSVEGHRPPSRSHPAVPHASTTPGNFGLSPARAATRCSAR